MTNPMQFPDGFVFGGATAAYQVEGETRTHGKGKVPWDDFLAAQGRFSPDPASDFYNKYPVDIDRRGQLYRRQLAARREVSPGQGFPAHAQHDGGPRQGRRRLP